ncbi:MAG: hypothetical protein ACI3XM_11550 [Eubacteriales bacterium]
MIKDMNVNDGNLIHSLWEACGGEALRDTVPDALLPELMPDSVPETDSILSLLDGQDVCRRIAQLIGENGSSVLSRLGFACGLLFICSLWQRYRAAVHNGEAGDMFSHITTLLLSLWGFLWFGDMLKTALSYFASIHTQMTAALTTMTALYAMRGMATGAAVAGVGMAFILSVCETITCTVLPPFIKLCAAFSLASSVGDGFGLSGISELLRKQFLWLVGALMTILTAVLSYQSVLAQSADSVSMRALKFTLSGILPIVGNAVGEAVTTVAAGFSLVGKTVGVFGIVLILWQILPPLIGMLLARLVFSLSAVFASVIGLEKEEALLRECGALTGFLCAVMTAEGLLYILMLTLCMKGF